MKLLAIAILGLAGAARADALLATDHDGTLVVSRVTDAAVETAYEEPNSGVLEYAFSDPHTLWVLRAKHGTFSIGTIVDGKPGTERVLSRDDWEPKTPLDAKSPHDAPHLAVGDAGEVWLRRCVDTIEDPEHRWTSCTPVYLRVDTKAPLATAQPNGLRTNVGDWHRRVKTLDTPPKRYKMVSSDHAFHCINPGKRLDFEGGTRTVANIEWIWSEPAIVRFQVYKVVSGKPPAPSIDSLLDDDEPATTPKRFTQVDDGTGQFLLEDCKTYLNEVVVVAPDVVATTEGARRWDVRRGRKLLGTLTSARLVAW